MPVYAGDVISAFQQQEGGVNRMHKKHRTQRNKVAVGETPAVRLLSHSSGKLNAFL